MHPDFSFFQFVLAISLCILFFVLRTLLHPVFSLHLLLFVHYFFFFISVSILHHLLFVFKFLSLILFDIHATEYSGHV